jgi:nucleoside-diphosphate-sugar epimerase
MPVIGTGDIASVIPDRPDRLYFASGVSNSGETRLSEFMRECDMLLMAPDDLHLVYFSSLCVFYSNTPYARHKRYMEDRVRDWRKTDGYTIVRLGNITWGKNPNTLINFMRARVRAYQPLEIQDVYRYVIDQEEFLHWINMIPAWSCELNIPGRRMKVRDIVSEYVLPEQPAIAKDLAVLQAYGY